ncbi:MAG: HipA domain-containing protein [Nitrosomonas sp.]|nr:HipA domain-containing protein [Nitrosomonas sp.]MCW5609013.1 HipA domain-containing protein [Nitrosomonas sp.]
MSHEVAGPSVAGKFPKFTATRWSNNVPVSVIVKFSGADNSAAVQRWSDLLVCEHLALETLQAHTDIAAAQSRIHRFAGRTFLEVARFDRTGLYGRLPICTLGSLADALIGQRAEWPVLIETLVKNGWLASGQASIVKTVWLFGRLIANADMHEGNLSFRPGLTLAPIYDMLPMQYAPARGGELAPQRYSPPLPFPQEINAWRVAAHAALWRFGRLLKMTRALVWRFSKPVRKIMAS